MAYTGKHEKQTNTHLTIDHKMFYHCCAVIVSVVLSIAFSFAGAGFTAHILAVLPVAPAIGIEFLDRIVR